MNGKMLGQMKTELGKNIEILFSYRIHENIRQVIVKKEQLSFQI